MAMLYIRDKATRKIKYVEEAFSSLVWTERYQEAGEFVLEIPLKDANVEMYNIGDYISMDESDESMVINSIDIDDEVEDPLLKIEGRSLVSLLDRRVDQPGYFNKYANVYSKGVGTNSWIRHSGGCPLYKGTYSQLMHDIFTDNALDPIVEGMYFDHVTDPETMESEWVLKMYTNEAPERKMLHFSFQNLVPSTDDPELEIQTSEVNDLLTLFTRFAKKAVKGFRVIFDDNDEFVLQAYSGKDRRTAQNLLSPVVFDPIMDNIMYVNYHNDDYDYKTIGFGYSDEYKVTEGLFGTMFIDDGSAWSTPVDGDPGDIDRREVSLDMSSKSSTEDTTEDEGTGEETTTYLSPVDPLFEDGNFVKIQTSEGSVDPLAQYQFERDYFLGDLVDLSNSNGIFMEAIIDEVVRSYDSDGIIVTPNFTNLAEYDDGEEDA